MARLALLAALALLAVLALLASLLMPDGRGLHAQARPPVFVPIVRAAPPETVDQGLTKSEAIRLYESSFLPHTLAATGWTGDHGSCNAGQLAPAFTDATLKLVNYFRVAAGVPPVVFDPALNARAQQAALMYSVNRSLSHKPPSNWKCYTAEGADAAAHSNASLFSSSAVLPEVAGVRGQMEDLGDYNTQVGHRRWILLSTTTAMGMGHVPSSANGMPAGGALWVLPRQLPPGGQISREPFVAWPPPGYIPWQALYHSDPWWYEHHPEEYRLRWSFQLWDARFDGTSIAVTHNGSNVAVHRLANVGEWNEAAVFAPELTYAQLSDGREHEITVTIAGVIDASGARRDFTYTVYIFDAERP